MFEFYFSEDIGLLNEKAEEFRKKNPKCISVKNPDISELNVLFLQNNLFVNDLVFLVEGFVGEMEDLLVLLNSIKLNDYYIMLLLKTNKSIFPEELLKLCSNSKQKINKLTESTKKSYLDALLKKNKISFSPKILKFIKTNLTTNAFAINEFVKKISLLDISKLGERELISLLEDPTKEKKYFSFWNLYLKSENYDWIAFLNSVNSVDSFHNFFHTTVYKICDFKMFLNLREGISDVKEIAKKLKVKEYKFFEYDSLLKIYNSKIFTWIDQFIEELYFLQKKLIYSYQINIDILKYFLIKKKEELNNERR